MAEYIDREALLKHLQECRETSVGSCPTFAVIAAVQAYVGGMPAADVAPVVHGKWISNGISGSMLSGCSVCGYTCGAYSFQYCPNCGAKMDGKGEGDGQKD